MLLYETVDENMYYSAKKYDGLHGTISNRNCDDSKMQIYQYLRYTKDC